MLYKNDLIVFCNMVHVSDILAGKKKGHLEGQGSIRRSMMLRRVKSGEMISILNGWWHLLFLTAYWNLEGMENLPPKISGTAVRMTMTFLPDVKPLGEIYILLQGFRVHTIFIHEAATFHERSREALRPSEWVKSDAEWINIVCNKETV